MQWQVNLDSVYKRYKTPRRFPPRIPLQTYCDASNHLGMIIFAPVPLRCPTSRSRNGCQVLFGLERIKLSPPCCALIYCFRHFHIGFILTRSAAARGSRASRLGPREMALDRGTVPASPGDGVGIAGGRSARHTQPNLGERDRTSPRRSTSPCETAFRNCVIFWRKHRVTAAYKLR